MLAAAHSQRPPRRNSLPAREREVVILRVGYLCKSGYEWTQHVAIAQRSGLTDAEIARVKLGTEGKGWSAADIAPADFQRS